MNMIVANTASLVATMTNQGGTNKASGGDGFAGALVQALGGQAQPNSSGSGLSLPVGLAALIGQLGTGDEETDGDSLLAALNEWLQQLTNAPQEDSDTEESQDALSEMLAALQALLENWTVPVVPTSENAVVDNANGTDPASTVAGGTASSALLLVLQNLNQASQNNGGKLDARTLKAVAEQLKQVIAEAGAGAAAASNNAQDDDSQAANATATNRVGIFQAIGTNGVQQQATTQTIHQQAAMDTKKATAFKEPVVYWNLQQESTPSAQDSDSSVVNTVGESPEAGDNQTALAWTLQAQDLAAQKTDSLAAKPALPAQVPVQQFSQQVGNYLVKQFVLSNGNGFTEARISLTPEHLGQVDVRITMQDGQLTAQFLTHSGTAKELIENQMGMLRSALQSQGIQVDRIDVVQQPQESSDSTSFMSEQDRGSGSERNGSQSRQERGGALEDPVSFEDELERTSLIREAGFGSSINTTA